MKGNLTSPPSYSEFNGEGEASQSKHRTPYKSTWAEPLPEDEIGRQERVKERLKPGIEVVLDGIPGKFRYSGLWDTMHIFYPADGQSLSKIMPQDKIHYLKRDLRGIQYLRLPYTLLADIILSFIPEKG